MKTLEYTEEEINIYDFFSAWHTDDKEWVKARQKKWKVIRSKLDQLDQFIGLDRKHYKLYKSYFMTGYSEPITDEIKNWKYNKQPVCILGDDSALFAFWLSPDHSQENWNRIKCAHVYDVIRCKDERIGKWDWYIKTCYFFRDSARCYQQVEYYSIKSRTADRCRLSPYYNCNPIFDGLEEFLFDNLPVLLNKDGSLDMIKYEGGDPAGGSASDYIRYLRGDGFNPANPRRYFVDDFIKWSFITDIPPTPYGDYRAKLVAIAWHVTANPIDYHPLQVEVAQKLKAGITELKDQLPDVSLDNLKRGISMFEEGLKDSFYKRYPDEFKGVYYDFMIKKLGLKFWKV